MVSKFKQVKGACHCKGAARIITDSTGARISSALIEDLNIFEVECAPG
jgi:hypothetical protein